MHIRRDIYGIHDTVLVRGSPLHLILLSLCASLPRATDPAQLALLALPHPLLHLAPAGNPDGQVAVLSEGVHTHTQGRLGGQHATDLALVLGSRLPHERGVVDEAVLGSVVLSLESSRGRRVRNRVCKMCRRESILYMF